MQEGKNTKKLTSRATKEMVSDKHWSFVSRASLPFVRSWNLSRRSETTGTRSSSELFHFHGFLQRFLDHNNTRSNTLDQQVDTRPRLTESRVLCLRYFNHQPPRAPFNAFQTLISLHFGDRKPMAERERGLLSTDGPLIWLLLGVLPVAVLGA